MDETRVAYWNTVLRLRWDDIYDDVLYYCRAKEEDRKALAAIREKMFSGTASPEEIEQYRSFLRAEGREDETDPRALAYVELWSTAESKTRVYFSNLPGDAAGTKKHKFYIRQRYRLGFRADDHSEYPLYFCDANPPPWTLGYAVGEDEQLQRVQIVEWPREELPVKYRLIHGNERKQRFLEAFLGDVHRGSFAGAKGLFDKIFRQKYLGISRRFIERFLKNSDAYRLVRSAPERTPVKSYRPERVNDIWQIDTTQVGGEDATVERLNRSCKKLLVILDLFSKMVWLRPLKAVTAEAVARNLEAIFLEGHIPRTLVCDRGTEFKGEVIDLCKRWNVRLAMSAPYSPQTQGGVERMNYIVKRHIYARMQARNTKLYVDVLPLVEYGINNSRSGVTGQTPFEIHYGRSFARPMDDPAVVGIEADSAFDAQEALMNRVDTAAPGYGLPPQLEKRLPKRSSKPSGRRDVLPPGPRAVHQRHAVDKSLQKRSCEELEAAMQPGYDMRRRPTPVFGKPGTYTVYYEPSWVSEAVFRAFEAKSCGDVFPFDKGATDPATGKVQVIWRPIQQDGDSHLKRWREIKRNLGK